MKRLFALFISVFIIISAVIPVFAADNIKIFAEKTDLILNDITLIPIEIKDNKGIMGFKINLNCKSDKVRIVKISRGSLTKTGNFNTNLGISDTSVDVLWNETKDVTDDGSLFVIGIKATDYFDSAEIVLSYSKDDTFNEKWEDVNLECENIVLSCKKDNQNPTTAATTESGTDLQNNGEINLTATQEQMLDAVDITFQKYKIKSVNEIKEKDQTAFLNDLNTYINGITGDEAPMFSKYKEFLNYYNDAYENVFIQNSNELIDSGDIKAAIDAAIKKYDATKISEIPDDKKEKFVDTAEDDLKSLNRDMPEISEDVDSDTALTIIKKLYGSLALIESSNDFIPPKQALKKTIIYIAVPVIAVVCVLSVTIVIRRKKREQK